MFLACAPLVKRNLRAKIRVLRLFLRLSRSSQLFKWYLGYWRVLFFKWSPMVIRRVFGLKVCYSGHLKKFFFSFLVPISSMTTIGNVFNGINGLLGHKSTDWGSWVMGGGDPWGRSNCAQKPQNPSNKMKATMVIFLKIHGDANDQRTQ